MAKIDLKNIRLSSLPKLLVRRIGVLFGIILLLLVAGEVLIIKDSVAILTGGGISLPANDISKGAVRVDFKNYEAAIKRIEDASTYIATSSVPIINPFGQP